MSTKAAAELAKQHAAIIRENESHDPDGIRIANAIDTLADAYLDLLALVTPEVMEAAKRLLLVQSGRLIEDVYARIPYGFFHRKHLEDGGVMLQLALAVLARLKG